MSKRIVTGREAGTQIAEALGLDPERVIEIELNFNIHEAATARVEMFLNEDDVIPIYKILAAYKWVEDAIQR